MNFLKPSYITIMMNVKFVKVSCCPTIQGNVRFGASFTHGKYLDLEIETLSQGGCCDPAD